MQLPLQITFRHMASSDAVATRIRGRAEELERFFDRMMSCRVVVECREKLARRDQRVAVAQPRERFDLRHATGAQVEQRLIVHAQRVLAQHSGPAPMHGARRRTGFG